MKTTPLLNHSIFASDEHLFYNCEIKRSFWVALRSWLMECNSGALARASRARSGASWVRKFGKLSIRENLVIT